MLQLRAEDNKKSPNEESSIIYSLTFTLERIICKSIPVEDSFENPYIMVEVEKETQTIYTDFRIIYLEIPHHKGFPVKERVRFRAYVFVVGSDL